MLPAQTDIICGCPSKEELVLPRTTTLSKVQQEGRHSDNVFPRERASERAECRRRRRAICRNELHFESGWDWEALTYRARCVSGMTNHYYTRIPTQMEIILSVHAILDSTPTAKGRDEPYPKTNNWISSPERFNS